MKILFVLTALLLASPAIAEETGTSVGATLGSPIGFTGRTALAKGNSVDYGLGWDILDTNKLQIYSDYLWARPDTFEIDGHPFELFYGAGLVVRTHSTSDDATTVFGPRVPVGVSYYFTHPDVELFATFALDFGIIPHTDIFVDAAVGARFLLF